ncbi:secreted glucosidase [Fusarium longipes]|uniref:Secreted glucosidase n=1 Tax=Fusarium longipes TaxID=694270 RepID=A0A395SX76_9HYPO|nr:secreted glucosidase [Fusarium longipes]
MRFFTICIASTLLWLAGATPSYEGFDLIWEDSFEGSAGSLPDTSKWIMQDWFKDLNGDWQTYTTNAENQQLSGQGSLLIIPLRDSSATKGWTSGRLESAYTFIPAPGARTIAEASIRLGSAPASGKTGIWPAFWLLGDSHRKGTLIWPACGEIDIMENVNGETKTQGVIHCDKNPGGICNEKNGIAGATALPDGGSDFHTYTAVIDRTPDNWMEESVTFFLDGKRYHQVTGAMINNEEVWGKIAHNLIHFILNVAVGGEWPGDPDESTVDGMGNAMEVKYVAHLQSTGSGGVPASQGMGDGKSQSAYDVVTKPEFSEPPPPPAYPRPHDSHSPPAFHGHPQPQPHYGGDFDYDRFPESPAVHPISDPDEPSDSLGQYQDSNAYDRPSFPAPQPPFHQDLPALEKSYGRPDYGSSPFSSHYPPASDQYPSSNDMYGFPSSDESEFPPQRNIYSSEMPHYHDMDEMYDDSESQRQSYPPQMSHDSKPQWRPGTSRKPQSLAKVGCEAPSAGSPEHGSYGIPGGWGPGTGKECPDSVNSMLKTRQVSSSGDDKGEPESNSGSSKPDMPYRFKTPSYPPAPGPDAIAPPTVAHGEFGGIQAKDKSKDSKRDMPNRFKAPGYPPAPAPAPAPPAVSSGEYGGVQAEDKAGYLALKGLNEDEYVILEGLNEMSRVPAHGVPEHTPPGKAFMASMVFVVFAVLTL